MQTDLLLFTVYITLLIGAAMPLGGYMARVFNGEESRFEKGFAPLERCLYKLGGVGESKAAQMNWKQYAFALFVFNLLGMALLFVLQMAQRLLPLNPQSFGAVESWHLALNTAISFMTNTNWQAYGGESSLSYCTQMAGLTVQNFLSAATGITVAIALMRGLTRRTTHLLGNFWEDLVRCTVRVLLPLSIAGAVLLMQQGVIQNFDPYLTVQTLDGGQQTIAMGPVASQEAIKMLGTNGGGFFNANSAHPFENPTPLTNFYEMFLIFILPMSLVFTFGYLAKDRRQGYTVGAAMLLLFVCMLGACYAGERFGNPSVAQLGVSAPTSFEGKEVRFGLGGSALFTTVTTAASCGAVNNMHDSLTPLGGLVPMLQMMLGEIVFGGVGAGFYGMMLYVFITVFIVGLMVGRTPEYLGKKIEAFEMKMVLLALLIPSCGVLLGSAAACVLETGVASLHNAGPHGLSEILYAFASGFGNNGSAFAGLAANTLFYNLAIGAGMFIGRFAVIFPVLAVAGSMAEKRSSPAGAGTFASTGNSFVLLLSGVVLIVGALTFLPALSLGPVAEQVLLWEGAVF